MAQIPVCAHHEATHRAVPSQAAKLRRALRASSEVGRDQSQTAMASSSRAGHGCWQLQLEVGPVRHLIDKERESTVVGSFRKQLKKDTY